MVVVISYFDTIQGPLIKFTYPQIEITPELRIIEQGLDLTSEEGFLSTADKRIRTISYVFSIPSPRVRGGQIPLSLSCLITESEPREDLYRRSIKAAVDRIKKMGEIYKVFCDDEDDQPLIRNVLLGIMEDLDRRMRMKDITTLGYQIRDSLLEGRHLPVPADPEVSEGRLSDSYLVVYKKEPEGAFALKGYPIKSRHVYKVNIYTDQFDMRIIRKVTRGFGALVKGRIIYSSGLCRETDVCSIELYFEYDGDKTKIEALHAFLSENVSSISEHYPLILWTAVPEEQLKK